MVWSTGNKASPLNEAITGVKKDKKESIITNDKMQVIKEDGTVLENVYALGDCAQIEGNPLPATAQVSRESRHELTSGRQSARYSPSAIAVG